jgi:hypothetical protein
MVVIEAPTASQLVRAGLNPTQEREIRKRLLLPNGNTIDLVVPSYKFEEWKPEEATISYNGTPQRVVGDPASNIGYIIPRGAAPDPQAWFEPVGILGGPVIRIEGYREDRLMTWFGTPTQGTGFALLPVMGTMMRQGNIHFEYNTGESATAHGSLHQLIQVDGTGVEPVEPISGCATCPPPPPPQLQKWILVYRSSSILFSTPEEED